MFKNPFYKDVAKALILLMVVLLLCRFTAGGMALVIIFVGIGAAATRRAGWTTICYLMFPLLAIFNRAIIGVSALTLFMARIGCLSMTALLILTSMSSYRGRMEKLPLGTIFIYVVAACLSSMSGWMPFISYMKIFNFTMMLVGIFLIVKIMQKSEKDLYLLRVFLMAVSLLMIVGSLLSYFVPSIGYSMTVYRMDSAEASQFLAEAGKVLFNGLAHHSQILPPVVIMLASWVLFDMILIERKISKLHVIILACVPPLAYMSRSRGALLELVAVVGMTFVFALPKVRISQRLRSRFRSAMFVGIVLLIGAGGYFQVKNDAISRWLRKTDDVAKDSRTLGEAFTGSRQGLIEENLRDFRRNPLFGSGFQVVEGLEQAYKDGRVTWYSASIEKGVTPYVILGETGIVGVVAFTIFLVAFYTGCVKRRYYSLMVSFTCFLVANLADSTIFSPSGMGGFLWVIACIGAFSTDVMAKRMGQNGQMGRMMPSMPMVRPNL